MYDLIVMIGANAMSQVQRLKVKIIVKKKALEPAVTITVVKIWFAKLTRNVVRKI